MKLIHPRELTFDPPLVRAKGTSYARTRDRALRAWSRGAGQAPLYEGKPVLLTQVDWSKLTRESTASGKGGTVAGRVSLDAETDAQLDALAEQWGLTRTQALKRILLDAATRLGSENA